MNRKFLFTCLAAGASAFFTASAYQADSEQVRPTHAPNKHVKIHAVGCEIGAVPECQTVTVRVWDGDTFLIHPDGSKPLKPLKIRIENIDAPEIDGKCAAEIKAAQTAKHRLAALLENREVRIIPDGIDRYHRQLASVLVDGKDVGEIMIAEATVRRWDGRRRSWC
ncbi:thermonuclease family protein [Agrobacterium vitis]|uniref:thermonuclease family protein n=1 Tax=Allorhizobium ampelinum TaxID=3025782 RepID=UPI001F3127C5|nr:thermonuclease family protein [Allorhizobium ampelinum]MCF1450190.1 thermonuclease family protein [Allorhizobium ampelinum]